MCGIVGKFSWMNQPDPESIRRMADYLRHRGPDAEGVWSEGVIALGHRRLSIIDTRAVANQPLADTTGRYRIVFNGEIYNFRELRAELEAKGARFATQSDTEVIIEAWRHWGPDALSRFNGMFAFALWDRDNNSLTLARDRLGKKPLFFARLPDGGIVFASELKALAADPAIGRHLDRRALRQYLSLGYILGSACILSGVEKLPPAHYVTVTQSGFGPQVCYWDLAAVFRSPRIKDGLEEAASTLRDLLDESTRLRLVADVPLGAFLSGGLDSSSIVAAMGRHRDNAGIQTFSAGFTERGFDERSDARVVADALGVTHRDILVSDEEGRRAPVIAWFADEPFADTSIFPTFALAELARKHVTVCLSGDGGDELFSGYPTYLADQLRRGLAWLPPAVPLALRGLLDLFPEGRGKVSTLFKLKQFLAGCALDEVAAHFAWRRVLSDAEVAQLLRSDIEAEVMRHDPMEDFRYHAAALPDAHYLDRMMYIDIKTWLPDDILVKVDRATMAHSLEARAPFLDWKVVEFAARLPTKLKQSGFRQKVALRASQQDRLPKSVFAKAKAGFNAPVASWMGKEGQGLFADVTPEDIAGDLFRPEAIRALCREHWSGQRDHGFKLLTLLNLHHWRTEFASHHSATRF